nr:RNA-directed DNA polymerase, eukaryota [Tanacetum cinerariifolium]
MAEEGGENVYDIGYGFGNPCRYLQDVFKGFLKCLGFENQDDGGGVRGGDMDDPPPTSTSDDPSTMDDPTDQPISSTKSFIHGGDGKVGKDTNTVVWSCWTNIVNEIKILRRQGVNVLDFMRLKLGNGDMTAFWDDNWIGGGVFKELYPRIYALETCKTLNASTKLNDSSLDNSFRRRTRGGVEQAQYDALSDLLNAVTLVPMADGWVWSLESSGEFSVASICKVIDEKRLSIVNSMTWWVKYVAIKVNVLAWKVKIDALPTRLNISRRGIDIDTISCPICDCWVESSNHLFFSCSSARQIARKISLWWNVNYVVVNSYIEWLNWLVSLRLTAKLKVMIEGVLYAMWWYLWSYRNKLLFETKVPLKAVIFDDVVSSSFYWCRFRCKASFS